MIVIPPYQACFRCSSGAIATCSRPFATPCARVLPVSSSDFEFVRDIMLLGNSSVAGGGTAVSAPIGIGKIHCSHTRYETADAVFSHLATPITDFSQVRCQ
jgi:hypothetical protein